MNSDEQRRHASTVVEVLGRLADNERGADVRLSMVASENRMSSLARTPLLLDVYNRYFFNIDNLAHLWQFRGGQEIWDVEGRLVRQLGDVLSAKHVTVRPLSGISAMTVVFAALGGPVGGSVVSVARPQGGHPSARPIAERFGFKVAHIGGPSPHEIDLAQAERTLVDTQPGLVYVDQSSCLFPTDIAALSKVVRRACPHAVLHVDVSHWLGLIIGEAMPNPLLCGADSISASTHKTFPGPQKALIASNDDAIFACIKDHESYLVSSHHYGVSLTLALALWELLGTGHREYARAVVANTRAFGDLLAHRGLVPECRDRGYSAGHQLWVSSEQIGVHAYELSGALGRAGIHVNSLEDLPDMPKPSLRLGLHEATYRGFGTEELAVLADVFLEVARDLDDISRARAKVERLCAKSTFPFQLVDEQGANTAFVEGLVDRLRASMVS